MGKHKLDQIRCVIYDYIDITPLERIIIEDPYFQRLRFIYQNSSAYLTYPGNQLTRFSHSLGVMHIGGLMFTNGLSSASTDVMKKFYRRNRTVLEDRIEKYELSLDYEALKSEWNTKNGGLNFAKFGHNHFEDDELFILNVYWQSLRIACLCHDIGHLPFSHIFEMAIDEFNNRNGCALTSSLVQTCIQEIQTLFKTSVSPKIKATDLHELIGAFLLCSIYKSLSTSAASGITNDILKLCLGLAIEMFLHGKREYSPYEDEMKDLLNCYYEVISSDLDADRLDYILRDARSSGIDLGNFDYTRILMNLELVQRGGTFSILPSDKSVSSIDQFYNYRYLMYEYVYYHHNVAKYDGMLIEILENIFHEIFIDNNESLKLLCIEKYHLFNAKGDIFPLKKKRNEIEIIAYDYYDDCWLRNFLHDVYIIHQQGKLFSNEIVAELIETFLFRIKANSISWAKSSVQIDRHLSSNHFQHLIKSNPGFRLKYFIDNEKKLENEALIRDIQNIKTTIKELGTVDDQLKKLADFFASVTNEQIPELPLSNDTRIKFRNYLNDKVFDNDKKLVSGLQQNLRDSLKKKGITLIMKNMGPKLLSDAQRIIIKDSTIKPLREASFYLENLKNLSKTHFKYYFAFFGKNINDKDPKNEQLISDCEHEVSNSLFELIDHGLLSSITRKFSK